MNGTKVKFNEDKLHYASLLMKAVAHPLRLRILEFIDTHQQVNVNKIYRTLDLEQSITSQHLKILRIAGVVDAEKDGKYMQYSIKYNVLEKVNSAVYRFIDREAAYYAIKDKVIN